MMSHHCCTAVQGVVVPAQHLLCYHGSNTPTDLAAWWLLDPTLLFVSQTKSNPFKLVDSVDVKPFCRSYQTSEKLYQPRIGVITLSIRIAN